MIQLLQAKNFRMLRSNSVALQPYQVLVGQNATGKSTFLNALQFISDVVKHGVRYPVELIAASFYDLCFDPGEPISLALEFSVPISDTLAEWLRYEIQIGITEERGLQVLRENLFLLPSGNQLGGEPAPPIHVGEEIPQLWKRVIGRNDDGTSHFQFKPGRQNFTFRLSPDQAALGSLLPEEFILALIGQFVLRDGIRTLQLDATQMRGVSPPGGESRIAVDGSNLPHVIRAFKLRDPVLFDQWVRHVALAVEGLESVDVWERPEDRALVLRVRFAGQHQEPVPAWMLSDGTLRLMALTLVSYATTEADQETYLIEEPENGLHPLAIQVVHETLSKPPAGSQVLCATHSPIFLAQTDLEHALVFRRAPQGYATIRRASEIPELKEWAGRVNLADLFVTGVLA
jgi:energy-coupling factor transporter ATP-binding protein EcfA2